MSKNLVAIVSYHRDRGTVFSLSRGKFENGVATKCQKSTNACQIRCLSLSDKSV